MLPTSSFSETLKTNLNNVVIKNARCLHGSEHYVEFTISNRSSNAISGKIFVTSFDPEKDPIGNGNKKINLGPVSGDKFRIWGVNCSKKGTFAFRFQ